LTRRVNFDCPIPNWINSKFLKYLHGSGKLQEIMLEQIKPIHCVKDDHYTNLSSGLLCFLLEIADRSSAHFALEARYPFFDRRLVEFCLSLPSEQKYRDGWDRFVFRRAMETILPLKVQRRPRKQSNLARNFNHGLCDFGKEQLKEAFVENKDLIAPYVNIEKLHKICDAFIHKKKHSDSLSISLWRIATLSLWLQKVQSVIRV
jgi:asparagine synthase (glutamine-hydrolysing)